MKKLIYFFLITLLISSCEWISPEIDVPSYIEIQKFDFESQPGQGSSSSNITDAWVYVNGQKIGAFEIPAKFPVLSSGNCDIIIYAGVKLNGTSATRAAYTMYEKYTINANLKQDSLTIITPSSTYAEGITFEFIEDFESIGMIFDKTTNSDTIIDKTSDSTLVFEGNYCGEITLTENADYAELKTIESYVLPQVGGYCFLEINTKSTTPISIGVYANESSYSTVHPIAIITPSDKWKKIYVNLTPTISRLQQASDFNIFISAQLEDGKTQDKVWIDNIKLIH